MILLLHHDIYSKALWFSFPLLNHQYMLCHAIDMSRPIHEIITSESS